MCKDNVQFDDSPQALTASFSLSVVPLQNFTDVAATFATVIKVLEDSMFEFKEYSIKIWIRRAAPNYLDRLRRIEAVG